MAYNSPYQPGLDKSEFRRVGMQAGQTVIEKTIIYGAQFIKFVILFVIDAIGRVVGK